MKNRLCKRILELNFHIFSGSEESGKSTLMKQMRIIHGTEYTKDERLYFLKHILKNIILAMKTLIDSMDGLNLLYESPENAEKADFIKSINVENDIKYEDVETIKNLWADAGIIECYNRKNRELKLENFAQYFLPKIELLVNPYYLQ